MTVERTTFQVEVTGEQAAMSDIRQVERGMDRLAAKARATEAQVGKMGRWESLLARARANGHIKRNGAEVGPLEFNAAGFGLNRGFVRGAGGGAGGAALAVAALAHGSAAAMNQVADARDYLRDEKATAGEVARHFGLNVAEGVLDFFGVHALARSGRRLFQGKSEEQVAAEEAEYRRTTFQTRERVAREDRAEAKAARIRAEGLAAQRRQQADALAQMEAYKRRAHAESDSALERELAGIKHETLPVGLPRRLAEVYVARRNSEAVGRHIRRLEKIERDARKPKDGDGE